jgi:hypothetical protein
MTRTFILPIGDDDLRQHLKARDTLFFVGQPHVLKEQIQQQLERLGFGSSYNVSATPWQHSDSATIRVEPIATAA